MNRKIKLSFSVIVTKEMQTLKEIACSNEYLPFCSYIFFDVKNGYIVASSGLVLQGYKVCYTDIQGNMDAQVLISKIIFSGLNGKCVFQVSEKEIAVTNEGNTIYLSMPEIKFGNWMASIPTVWKGNYIGISEPEKFLAPFKSYQGMILLSGKNGNIEATMSKGCLKIKSKKENKKLPFDFEVKMKASELFKATPNWAGGMFICTNYSPIAFIDKNADICILVPILKLYGDKRINYAFEQTGGVKLTDLNKLWER